MSEALDAIDSKILDLVQHDAALSVAEIAAEAGGPVVEPLLAAGSSGWRTLA